MEPLRRQPALPAAPCLNRAKARPTFLVAASIVLSVRVRRNALPGSVSPIVPHPSWDCKHNLVRNLDFGSVAIIRRGRRLGLTPSAEPGGNNPPASYLHGPRLPPQSGAPTRTSQCRGVPWPARRRPEASPVSPPIKYLVKQLGN